MIDLDELIAKLHDLANLEEFVDDALAELLSDAADALESVRAERDAAVAALERVRVAVSGNPECDRYEEGDVISCGWKSAYASVVAALDGAPEPECLSIPIPNVPFGPEGVAPTIATASYLIEVVKKIDFGYANVGGSNVTATLRKLLVDTAEALRGLPVEGEKP